MQYETEDIRIPKSETVDIKDLLRNFQSYWYYFLLSIIACVFIAFLYNRYTKPIYSVSTTIEIRDDNNSQLGVENIIEGMEMFSIKTNLENEKAVLQSYSLAERTIKELNLGISYFLHGNVKIIHLYNSSPFIVVLDSNHAQLAGVEYFIDILDDQSFHLRFASSVQTTYDVQYNKKNSQSRIPEFDYDNIHRFNEWIEHKYFRFRIVPDLSRINDINQDKRNQSPIYSYVIHPLETSKKKYVSKLKISPITKESSVLRLSLEGPDIKRNLDYLNKLTSLYLLQGLESKNKMAINTIQFIDQQINRVNDSLTIIEQKIEDFKKNHPELDVIDKDFGTFFQKQKVESNILESQVHLSYYKELLIYLEESRNIEEIVSPTSLGISNPELNTLISQYINLNSKKKELELSTKEKNPRYQAVMGQILYTRSSIIENLRNLISSSKLAENKLKKRVDKFNKQIANLPEAEKQYVKLKRQFLQNENIFNYLILKQQETTIAKEGTDSDHKVIDPARIDSNTPLSPKKKMSYILAIILGFLIPAIFIMIRDFFNERVQGQSDIEKITNIPIVGVIGRSETANTLIAENNPKSLLAEAFRSIRTNIQYLAADKKKKIISVSSSIGSEGKTFCASNLALILSLSGSKTIVIGADLRKPKLHKIFDIKNSSGLSSYLIDQDPLEDIIKDTKYKNLKIIPSGPIPPNPSELLEGKRMKDLISSLQKQFQYIIFDSPPIGLVTDGVIIMQYSDVNLYVVRHNFTQKKMLGIVHKLYIESKVSDVNLLINDYQLTSGKSGYGYGYGYDYSYKYGEYYEES